MSAQKLSSKEFIEKLKEIIFLTLHRYQENSSSIYFDVGNAAITVRYSYYFLLPRPETFIELPIAARDALSHLLRAFQSNVSLP